MKKVTKSGFICSWCENYNNGWCYSKERQIKKAARPTECKDFVSSEAEEARKEKKMPKAKLNFVEITTKV